MLHRFIVKMSQAAALAAVALGASAFVVLPVAAHSPLAVDQQGESCVQMDCQNDKITSRCAFPVQLTHECGENRNSHCAITAASIYNSAVENGVTVVGVPFASSVWSRNMLRPDGFYPMDIDRKGGIAPIDSDSKDLVHGYACAIHTDGSVTSAGTEWHNDENGIPRLVCVHTHTDGSKHTAVAGKPDFECPGEFINNWAAECLEYETKPLGDLDSGTRLTNKCKCPVVVDACIDSHPCHAEERRHTVLQSGESTENSPFPGMKIAWAACFQDDEPYTDDSPKSAENNLWTCSDVQTPCSKIETQGDNAVAMQFQALIQGEATQVPEEAKEEEQPAATEPELAESDDPLAALRGAPPPAGTATERLLRKCKAWTGQLQTSGLVVFKGDTKIYNAGESDICDTACVGTHLHWAAELYDLTAIRWLIANGADVHAKEKCFEGPPLHWASLNSPGEYLLDFESQNRRAAFELLISSGADVNHRNKDGWTAVDKAISQGANASRAILESLGGRCNKKC